MPPCLKWKRRCRAWQTRFLLYKVHCWKSCCVCVWRRYSSKTSIERCRAGSTHTHTHTHTLLWRRFYHHATGCWVLLSVMRNVRIAGASFAPVIIVTTIMWFTSCSCKSFHCWDDCATPHRIGWPNGPIRDWTPQTCKSFLEARASDYNRSRYRRTRRGIENNEQRTSWQS